MENKFLKLPFLTVKEFESDEISDRGINGLALVSNGIKTQIWFGKEHPLCLCDIPSDYICNEEESSDLKSTMNCQSEWVSGKTLLEIVKTLVNKNSDEKLEPGILYPPQPLPVVDDETHYQADRVREINRNLSTYINKGCNIYGTIEAKYKKFPWNPFIYASKFVLVRDSYMFALMAGVKNEKGVTPVAPVRDIPTNVSLETKEEFRYFGQDAYSASYLSYPEYKKAVEMNKQCDISYKAYLKFMEELEKEGLETRIVFWFVDSI